MYGNGKYGVDYTPMDSLHRKVDDIYKSLKPNGGDFIELLKGENGFHTSVGGFKVEDMSIEAREHRVITIPRQHDEHDDLEGVPHILDITDSCTVNRHRQPFSIIGQTTLPPAFKGLHTFLFYKDPMFAFLDGQTGPLVWSATPLVSLGRK